MFSTPKPQVAPPPVIEDTAGKAQDYQDALRRRKGRAAAILTDQSGKAPAPSTAPKTLLGS